MRKIKFRGKRKDNGEVVAGENFKFLRGEVYISDGTNWFEVNTESVVQFIGYDKFGDEVYEGDTVINTEGWRFTAGLCDGIWYFDDDFQPIPVEQFKLVKEN